MTATEQITVEFISLGALVPSPTNPRKRFDPATLRELADSIIAKGVLVPLIVREKSSLAPDELPPMFEIVAGERRFRAASLAALEAIPCLVRELSDKDAIEIQALENLQREDLTSIEEARCYQNMLDLREGEQPVYTVPTLAGKIGKDSSTIFRAVRLLKLPPDLQEKVESGELPPAIARSVASLPSVALQREAAKLILKPAFQEAPLSFRQCEQLMAEKFSCSLRGVLFDLADKELLPAAGSCLDCPKRTSDGKRDVCHDPECFKAKQAADYEQWAARVGGPGKFVLPLPQMAKAIEAVSPYVRADESPSMDLLSPGAAPEEAKVKWSALLDNNGTPVIDLVLARDDKGRLVELFDRNAAVAAAKKLGAGIFQHTAGEKVKRKTAEQAGDDWNREARQREERTAESLAVGTVIFREMMEAVKGGMKHEQFAFVLTTLFLRGFDGAASTVICTRRGWQGEKQVEAGIATMPGDKHKVLLLEMAIGKMVTYEGELSPHVGLIAKALGVDWKKIQREVKLERKRKANDKEIAESNAQEALLEHPDGPAILETLAQFGDAGVSLELLEGIVLIPRKRVAPWLKKNAKAAGIIEKDGQYVLTEADGWLFDNQELPYDPVKLHEALALMSVDQQKVAHGTEAEFLEELDKVAPSVTKPFDAKAVLWAIKGAGAAGIDNEQLAVLCGYDASVIYEWGGGEGGKVPGLKSSWAPNPKGGVLFWMESGPKKPKVKKKAKGNAKKKGGKK